MSQVEEGGSFQSTKINLRRAVAADAPEMVKIHQRAFEGFFLTKLGPGFLNELYRAFTSNRNCLAWVASDEQRIVGFVVGTSRPKGFFRQLLLRRGLNFLAASTVAFVRNPLYVGRRLASAVLYRGDFPTQMPDTGALLSSIAVHPDWGSRGIGRLLLEAFTSAAFQHGAEFVYLTTDQDDNDSANNFYSRAGFAPESTVARPGGRKMTRYVRAQVAVESMNGVH
jgi:ribosomal protein S18 acetylase RimI-like enzyme